ncbi:MAG: methyltransferase domain-containing protein, partial [Actinobacteria bacterium]|nr:methyltransferase domain-containing protein [Actinomycetota bacterium]
MNIFELGPGTGQKAAHLLSMHPMSYLAVDSNKASLTATREAIKSSKFSGNAEVKDQDFLTFESLRNFDLVLAELVLSTQVNPEKFLEKLLKITNNRGILVFTCCDPISMLSETLRKAITLNENLIDDDLKSSAGRCANFFNQDLDHLKGMNRIKTDWAIDQLIHPWIGPLLSIPNAIAYMRTAAVFHGSSPRFVDDYRWYKDPSFSVIEHNKNAIHNYWEKCHNFLDLRLTRSTRDANINKSLNLMCDELYFETYVKNWSSSNRSRILEICLELKSNVSDLEEVVNKSLESFIDYWQSGNIESLQEFRPFWGRGTQYLSFIKCHALETSS